MLEKPVHYGGQNPAMAELAKGESLYFADMDRLKRFFQAISPEAVCVPEPFTSPPADPDEYDLDRIVNLADVTVPAAVSSVALDYKTLQRELQKTITKTLITTGTIGFAS